MRDAMIDVIQSGTGRGIRTPMYQIAGSKQGQLRLKVLRKANATTSQFCLSANSTMVYLLDSHLLKPLKLRWLWCGKMGDMVDRQLSFRAHYLTIGC